MNYCIIGSSIAAKSTAETLIPRLMPDDRIVIVSDEAVPFYSRVLLPDYIAEKIRFSGLKLRDEHIVHNNRVRMVKDRVTGIDISAKKISCSKHKPIAYDKCFICSGASPQTASSRGDRVEGVFSLRTLDDARGIIDYSRRTAHCIVLGGGLVSLKAAWALRERGKKVAVAVSSPEILSRVADSYTARMIRKDFEHQGVDVHCGLTGGTIGQSGDGKVGSVTFREGNRYSAEMVIVGKGVRPNLTFASARGIAIDQGIIVDDRMETSAPDVYAAGDVAQPSHLYHSRNELITLWPEAVFQAKIAAENALGGNYTHRGSFQMNSVVFYGTPYIFYGDIREEELNDCSIYSRTADNGRIYRKIVLKDGIIIGAVIAGDVRLAGIIYWAIKTRRVVTAPDRYLSISGLYSLYEEYGERSNK